MTPFGESPVARRLTLRLWLVRAAVVLVLAAAAGPHAWAWAKVRAARAALAAYHPAEARRDLAAAARVAGWDGRPSVHLMLARACRQDDDYDGAVGELHAAQRLLGGATDETAYEWALLEAAGGNVTEVDAYLQRRIEQAPDLAPDVWEALIQGNLRVYRSLDAMACVKLWLSVQPDNPRALDLRGQTYVIGKGVVRGAEDFRRALELDPARDKTRWRLVVALIDLGGYQEAAEHLELLRKTAPDDPRFVAYLARCWNFVGRRDDARALLDDALRRFPTDPLCLRTRGQLALMEDRKAEAEAYLRRATAAAPEDYQAQWLLFEALRQQDKMDEAVAQQARADRLKEQVTRIGELQSRTLAEFPLDPALHHEMGHLLTQTGRGEVGERWFQSALALDPNHAPSHAALAALYQQRGDAAKAEFHRRRAAEAGRAAPPPAAKP